MANTINITSDTVVKLIIRRGTNSDRKTIVLASGELGYTIDTKRVYVGDGITQGGTLVGNKNFGIIQGIQAYTGIAQPGDIIFQNQQSTGAYDNTLYVFNNNQWQPISPAYSLPGGISGPLTNAQGYVNFNPTYFLLDTTNSVLNVYGAVNSYTLSANTATIYNQPIYGTDGTNKAYVDSQIAAAESIDQAYTRVYVGNNYVPLSGITTMFGTLSTTVNISVSAPPVLNADVTNKQYVDFSVANSLALSKAFTSLFLPLTGGTLTGTLSTNITTNGAIPAVSIKQSGNAPALVVQDVNRVTSQSFYVDNYGSVGVGVLPINGGNTALTVLGVTSASNIITNTLSANNVWLSSTNSGLTAPAVNTVAVNTAGTEALRVNASGNVGIGTTSPQYKLDITGNTNISGNLSVNGSISATGDVIAYTTSDERLKLNVEPITSALDKLDSINGVNYDWNTDLQTVHSGHDVGVLAQEIESVLPEAVITRADGYKAVNYEKIIPLLIQAIKELKANQQS